ncbi:hypothetical protein V6N13_059029 [Hibiscus sabdariffa]|uniref:Phospholipid/glycerol acyltransferase domain-containing protein n=1 Tax=Hibiscus sabdariffa TaxID=183260 RepID=A0ABR2GFE7_9ROSI
MTAGNSFCSVPLQSGMFNAVPLHCFYVASVFRTRGCPIAIAISQHTLEYKSNVLLWPMAINVAPFLFEKKKKTNGAKVVFSGDDVPQKERALIVVNHRTEIDLMYLWDNCLNNQIHLPNILFQAV